MKYDKKQDEVRSEVLRFMREEVGAYSVYECKAPSGHDLLWFVVGTQPVIIQVYPEGMGWCEYISPPHNDKQQSIANMKAIQDAANKEHGNGTQT
jgi:hypothetical protein